MQEIIKFYNKLHFSYCETIGDFLDDNPEFIDIDHISNVRFGLISKIPNTYMLKFLYKGVIITAYNTGIYICGMSFCHDKENTPMMFENVVYEWLSEHVKKSKELTIKDLKILQFYLECRR